ncbi:MAG: hypothetical protein QOJ93_786 [Actinomycetota bacterium]|jgi:hypothetical protein|nr:hypothetical protein [Actinomycetota bacterium]
MRPSDWCPMPRHRRSLVLPFLATVTALVGAACSNTTRPVREGSSRFLRGSK